VPQDLPQDLIVAVSSVERATGSLFPGAAERANAALRTHGCVVLRDMFDTSLIDRLYGEYVAQFGALDESAMRRRAEAGQPNRFLEVGPARYEITPRMTGVFAEPETFANGLLRKFLSPHLGDDMRLGGFTIVASHPGAEIQHLHRDPAPLFSEPSLAAALPVYAVDVAVPLIDVHHQTGPTGIWLGSHRWPPDREPVAGSECVSRFRRGDCVLLDYRTYHAGLPNGSERVRPILYMAYTRTWFFDEVNHVGRVPLDMPPEVIRGLGDAMQPLLVRAHALAMQARWHEVDRLAVAS
jgi:hypothetical protein